MSYYEISSGPPTLFYYGLRPNLAPFRGLLYCRTKNFQLITVLAVFQLTYHQPNSKRRTVHKQYIRNRKAETLGGRCAATEARKKLPLGPATSCGPRL